MVSAWRMGTPLLTSVPSVRVNREMATLLTTGPEDRHLEFELVDQTCRPNLVADLKRMNSDDDQNRPIDRQRMPGR